MNLDGKDHSIFLMIFPGSKGRERVWAEIKSAHLSVTCDLLPKGFFFFFNQIQQNANFAFLGWVSVTFFLEYKVLANHKMKNEREKKGEDGEEGELAYLPEFE